MKNIATFNKTDELILNDGLLWDIRSANIIHKFDKFNNYVSGVFHPSDLEIIINSEIVSFKLFIHECFWWRLLEENLFLTFTKWDLRSFHLLDTCPSLDQCQVTFNNQGNVIFGGKCSYINLKMRSAWLFQCVWKVAFTLASVHNRQISPNFPKAS